MLNAQWIIKLTRDRPDFAWANTFGRMQQVSMVGFAVGGSTVSLNMYDGFYVLIMLGAAARQLVNVELQTQTVPSPAPVRPALAIVK